MWIGSDIFYITTPRYATGKWFSLGPPVSSTNKTDHHDITENIKHVDVARYKCILYYSTSLRTVVGTARYGYIVRCGGETVFRQTFQIIVLCADVLREPLFLVGSVLLNLYISV